jgi:hypothetical protein
MPKTNSGAIRRVELRARETESRAARRRPAAPGGVTESREQDSAG